jgi:hypothetical protein
VCGVIINFVNIFRQMPVNTRRQTAGVSPLIKLNYKVSKKTKKKKIPAPIPTSEPVPIPVPELITYNEAQNLSILSDMSISQQIAHEVNKSQDGMFNETSDRMDRLWAYFGIYLPTH